jgi:peroxiredoxin Q/BCP
MPYLRLLLPHIIARVLVKRTSIIEGVKVTMTKYLLMLALLVAGTMALVASGKEATASADIPAVGASAPEFTLTNNEGKPTSLNEYRGKWVVLYFYPKDFTSGCTLEAHNFQRDLTKYEQSGAVILGVSVDTAESHKSFCTKEGLSFKLLSDPEAKVSTEYGSLMEYNGAKLSARNTFLIDPKGKIVQVFTKVKPAGHSEEVLTALADLQKK